MSIVILSTEYRDLTIIINYGTLDFYTVKRTAESILSVLFLGDCGGSCW